MTVVNPVTVRNAEATPSRVARPPYHHCSFVFRGVAICLAVVVIAVLGYLKAFTTWAVYDDEGYVLVSLINYLQGARLYEDVFTQYGPAFYQIESSLRSFLPFELTSDGQRWKTLLIWILVAIFCGWAATRLLDDILLGTAVGTIAFLHLDRLALEPGHPQMWCALLTAMLLLLLTHPVSDRPRWNILYWFAAGGLCGELALIKPNIGGLALGGVLAGVIWSQLSRESRIGRWFEFLFTTMILLGPWLLYSNVLSAPISWLAPTVATVSLFLVRNQCRNHRAHIPVANSKVFFTCLDISAGCILAMATTIAFVLWQGVSVDGLRQGLLSQHADLIKQFYHAAPLPAVAWVMCAMMMFACISEKLPSVHRWTQKHSGKWLDFVTTVAVLGSLVAIATDAGVQLVHGLAPHGAAGILAGPGCLLVWRFLQVSADSPRTSRASLPALAGVVVLAPLAAFPTPGTQIAVGTLGVLVLLFSTFLLRCQQAVFNAIERERRLPKYALTVVAAISFCAIVPLAHRWLEREPLGLNGAQRLRLSAEETQRYRALIASIQENGAESIAFSWHTRNSFLGWAGLPPLSTQSPTFWPYLLSHGKQERVLGDALRFHRIVVVDEDYEPAIQPPPSHLQRWLLDQSVPIAESQPFKLRLLIHPSEGEKGL